MSIDTTPWLGHVAEELTDEQRDEFDTLVNLHATQIVEKRPGYGTDEYFEADYADEDSEAWVAALEIVLGEFNLAQRGAAFRQAKDAAYQGAIMATLNGATESRSAADAGINRLTLRKALGK